MRGKMALGIGGIAMAVLLIIAVFPAAAQDAVRFLQENVDVNRGSQTGCPPGPFGDYRVKLYQNTLVDSYDSRVEAYDPANPGENCGIGSNCNPNDSNAGVFVEENSVVIGDISVTEADRITIDNNSTVTGDLSYTSQPWELKPIEMPTWYTVAGGDPEGTIIGEYGTKPGAYNITDHLFQACNMADVVFEPGKYHFEHFELMQNVRFNVGDGEGLVEIYIEGSIKFENNSELLYPIEFIGDTTKLRFYYSGTSTIDLSNNVSFYGFIYAPNAVINVKNNDQIYGSLVGKEVIIWDNGGVHYDEALGAMDFSEILGPPIPPPLRLTWKEMILTD